LDFKPFLPFWQSNIERTLRLRGMRENVFIQHQLPALLQVGDATSLFDLTHFKNGQQMLASEGVIATLFYHLQNQALDATQLAAFYKSLLTSLRALNGQKLTAGTPLFLNLVQAHIQRVPDSRSQWLSTVLNLTYGATASNEVIRNMTKLSSLGQEGRMDEFAVALKQSRASLAAVTAQVTRNPQRLGAAVGAELWLAVKQSDGSVATINLNTAERTSLMSVLGFESGDADLLLANRTARGPFSTVDDFATRRNAPPLLRRRLKSAHDMAATLEGYQR
jgi:DNA uptake protein ComE-like DNA-binding protein